MTRSESGSASIYVLAGALLIAVAAIVPLAPAAGAVARHRAAVAADAAALAGARVLVSTGSVASACLRAASLARANDAATTSCVALACRSAAASSLQVVVIAHLVTADVSVSARAGPVGCLAKQPPSVVSRRNLGPEAAVRVRP